MPSKSRETQARSSSKAGKVKAEPKVKTGISENSTQEQQGTHEKSQGDQEQRSSTELSEVFKNFTDTTSRIVKQAASILEEEVAAGIVAAKQVEERFINVSELRSGDPQAVMQRFRRDAHDVLDIIVDLINAAAKSVGNLAQRVITVGGNDQHSKHMGEVPTLRMPNTVKAGESAEVEMSLSNDSNTATDEFSFYSSDLINASGNRIPAEQITFKPSSLIIKPHQTEKVSVGVKVPEATPQGTYSGLLQATNLNQLKAVLTVEIG